MHQAKALAASTCSHIKLFQQHIYTQAILYPTLPSSFPDTDQDKSGGTHGAVEVCSTEEIEGHGGHQVQEEPSLDVVRGYPDGTQHHLPLLVDERRPEVQDDVCRPKNMKTLHHKLKINIHIQESYRTTSKKLCDGVYTRPGPLQYETSIVSYNLRLRVTSPTSPVVAERMTHHYSCRKNNTTLKAQHTAGTTAAAPPPPPDFEASHQPVRRFRNQCPTHICQNWLCPHVCLPIYDDSYHYVAVRELRDLDYINQSINHTRGTGPPWAWTPTFVPPGVAASFPQTISKTYGLSS